jgi:hypothetical protein
MKIGSAIFGLLLFCLLLLMSISTARAQDVTVDFDKSVDFSKLKTYSWTSGIAAQNYLIDQQIRARIEEHLATKGLRQIKEGGDLGVLYISAVETDVQVSTSSWVSTGNWMTPITSGISIKSQMWNVEMGRLVVCLFDASGKILLWRGTARTRLSDRSTKQNPGEAMKEDARKVEGKIRRAVEKMFRQFPRGKSAE